MVATMRTLITLTAVAGLAAPAAASPRRNRALVVAGALAVYVTSETVAKDALVPAHCRWCATDGLDDAVHGALAWDHPRRASILSDATAFGLVPVSTAGLLIAAPASVVSDDLLALAEVAVYSQIAIQITKLTFGRQRPYAHYADAARLHTNDDNLSFASGHSALTFSLAVAAGTIAHRRGDRLEPVVWATGLTLAATTAYLRMAAEQHYLTDVLGGAAIGTAAGLVLPRVLGGLPHDLQVAPTARGVALAGTF